MEKENITIVDSDDNVIGSKPRDQIDYSKDIYRSAALWLTNSKNQVLIAQRKLTKKKDPGMWGPAVAGTVEHNETYESNIYKEAEEEIGLAGETFDLGPKQFEDKERKHFIQWFTCNLDKEIDTFQIQEDEVEKIVWIDKEALIIDVRQNPQKYVPAMPEALILLEK